MLLGDWWGVRHTYIRVNLSLHELRAKLIYCSCGIYANKDANETTSYTEEICCWAWGSTTTNLVWEAIKLVNKNVAMEEEAARRQYELDEQRRIHDDVIIQKYRQRKLIQEETERKHKRRLRRKDKSLNTNVCELKSRLESEKNCVLHWRVITSL